MEGKLKLGYGCNRALECAPGVTTAWGARLIAPNDLVHDRQDLQSANGEERAALIAWLNGGAITGLLEKLRGEYIDGSSNELVELYDDGIGVIYGSAQGSGGYLYVAGWLYDHSGVELEPIPALVAYRRTGEGNPNVAQVFTAEQGWQDTKGPRRASVAYLERLQREGIGRVSVRILDPDFPGDTVGVLADFTIRELLESAGVPA